MVTHIGLHMFVILACFCFSVSCQRSQLQSLFHDSLACRLSLVHHLLGFFRQGTEEDSILGWKIIHFISDMSSLSNRTVTGLSISFFALFGQRFSFFARRKCKTHLIGLVTMHGNNYVGFMLSSRLCIDSHQVFQEVNKHLAGTAERATYFAFGAWPNEFHMCTLDLHH